MYLVPAMCDAGGPLKASRQQGRSRTQGKKSNSPATSSACSFDADGQDVFEGGRISTLAKPLTGGEVRDGRGGRMLVSPAFLPRCSQARGHDAAVAA